jgi:hypothetical protein
MEYPVSPESRSILEDLCQLRIAARALLDQASPDARDEWRKLESRFPSEVDLRRGIINLSKPELEEMRAKARRFRDILAANRRGLPNARTRVDRGPTTPAGVGGRQQHASPQKLR